MKKKNKQILIALFIVLLILGLTYLRYNQNNENFSYGLPPFVPFSDTRARTEKDICIENGKYWDNREEVCRTRSQQCKKYGGYYLRGKCYTLSQIRRYLRNLRRSSGRSSRRSPRRSFRTRSNNYRRDASYAHNRRLSEEEFYKIIREKPSKVMRVGETCYRACVVCKNRAYTKSQCDGICKSCAKKLRDNGINITADEIGGVQTGSRSNRRPNEIYLS